MKDLKTQAEYEAAQRRVEALIAEADELVSNHTERIASDKQVGNELAMSFRRAAKVHRRAARLGKRLIAHKAAELARIEKEEGESA